MQSTISRPFVDPYVGRLLVDHLWCSTRLTGPPRMKIWRSLAQRHLQPEQIDQPGVGPERLTGALTALERFNFASGSARIVWQPIAQMARETGLRKLSVLDVACGAGDVALRVWRRARRAGFDVAVEGCDLNPISVAHARRRASQVRADVRFFEADALGAPLPGCYDVVACSLFLHHLDEPRAIELLRRMAATARRLVLVNDLERSPRGWLLALAASRILTRSSMVHHDALRSVEGAFSAAEALVLAEQAGWSGARVDRRWPCRFLLCWQKPS
ncbi:MAG TPA: methyltransferase domain-containing protein [Pirellulales bacterium]|nr:methyltransferase domain-containing protein [Pirellulales bacterium]